MLASDNAAGVHPRLLAAIERANRGHALAYGHDPWTAAVTERFRAEFGPGTEVLLVFGGSGANVVALRAAVDSHHAVLCASSSHLWRDECNAPERFLGAKLVPIETPDGKLTPDLVRPYLRDFGEVHHAQPRAISVAQPTEWGTLYTPAELSALARLAHEHGMVLHVDGARLANAAAALDLPLGAFGPDLGVDAMSFGGTKTGMLAGEAVLLFSPELARSAAPFYRKQALQLASKMRFIAAQFEALLDGELWRDLAGHANRMARRLAGAIAPLPGVEVVQPVQTNAVFARLPPEHVEALQRQSYFHVWEPARSIARLMTAWDTEPAEVDAFAAALRARLGGYQNEPPNM